MNRYKDIHLFVSLVLGRMSIKFSIAVIGVLAYKHNENLTAAIGTLLLERKPT